jgi:hypothetical protein
MQVISSNTAPIDLDYEYGLTVSVALVKLAKEADYE